MLPAVYVVGCGRLGLGLALAIKARGVELAGASNRGAARRATVQKRLGMSIDELPAPRDAKLIVVCVNDDAIAEVGTQLMSRAAVDAVVVHTSGALPASALGELGRPRASLHPPIVLSDADEASRRLIGARFALEGDAEALPVVRQLVSQLGGESFTLAAADKARYHAALVLGSNLITALLAVAEREAAAVGLSDTSVVRELARSAVEQAAQMGPMAALTGPVVRGDVDTVRRHLAVLPAETAELYRQLSRQALGLARARGLDSQRADALAALLSDDDGA
jgi:predicted short-subunit dehydrogenase-like oxidoreductase (DUF2520 family)